MVQAVTATVSGRVQGVMFRDFTRDIARRLKLVGEARNMPDGTVRVYAEGPEQALHELLITLEKGPSAADVVGVSCEWANAEGRFDSFSIA